MNKYLPHTNGKRKDILDLSDVVSSKYFDDNIYRKNKRYDVLLTLINSDCDLKEYLNSIDKEALRLYCFYFSIYLMENSITKKVLIDLLLPVISEKIKQFNARLNYGKKDNLSGYNLISYIKRKI